MTSLFVQPGLRDQKKILLVSFPYDSEVISFLKSHGWRWDPGSKSWWMLYQLDQVRILSRSFPDRVHLAFELILQTMSRDLLLRNYSRRTIKPYQSQIRRFYLWASQDNPAYSKFDYALVPDSYIEEYLDFSFTKKNLSFASLRSILQSLRFFWKEILQKPFPKKIRSPRKNEELPDILSKQEIYELVACLPNPKHKLLLLLAYSSGLRVSEIVSLKLGDLDTDRMLIHVRLGKGKKDRMVPLSKTFQEYWKQHRAEIQKAENPYLFPGQYPGSHLSSRTAQKIFENAKKASRIHKEISFHSLRHAFATHLLESGTGMRHIQTLLGHKSIRTTERYARLSRNEILKVPSPLDLD